MIRFLLLDGKMCEDIKDKLNAIYNDHAPSMSTIRYWFSEFNHSQTSILEKGHPIKMATEDKVNKIHDIVLTDYWMKIREIATSANISNEHIES